MTSTTDILPVTAPAVGVPGPPQGMWTYAAYAALPDDSPRYEIVEGVLYMAPAPNIPHQDTVTAIATHLRIHVDFPGLGKVFVSPIDVELAPHTVVQPDVVVVLNRQREIVAFSRVVGAPDLVVEVSSPSTATYDRRAKMDAYARAGVSEYWIADPHAQTVELFTLEQGTYTSAGVFQNGAVLPSRLLPDLMVRVEQFFA